MKCAIEATVKYVKFLAQSLGVCDVSCAVLASLLELAIPVNYDGFEYLKTAILLAYEDPLQNLACNIYPEISRQSGYKVTCEQIEASIRNAIKIAWDYRDDDTWKKYFPGLLHKRMKRPTNDEFISGMAKFIELWYCCAQSYERKYGEEEVSHGI